MSSNDVFLLVVGMIVSSFILSIGLANSAPDFSYTRITALGESIGDGIGEGLAHAACIKEHGKWRFEECEFPK